MVDVDPTSPSYSQIVGTVTGVVSAGRYRVRFEGKGGTAEKVFPAAQLRPWPVPTVGGAGPPVGPPRPYAPWSPIPTELDEEGMAAVIDQFRRAAALAAHAGFDMLELDMGHGYLLGSFLSPLTNQRADAFGAELFDYGEQVAGVVFRK